MTQTAGNRDVTDLLQAWGEGDRAAFDRLLPLVHAKLHELARLHLRRERRDHTLQPTALVNEAYLRLVDQRRVRWRNRAQFFGTAAQMMRRILVDYSRERHAAKRGGHATRVALDDVLDVAAPSLDVDLMALDHALDRLASLDPRQSDLVVLRFFGGLSISEVAAVTNLSPSTVKREWAIARLWLHRELQGNGHEA